ncbi:MAG: ATP-binding protein [Pseudonocardiaceae bacterium]
MRIAFVGKGGSGKTTLSALFTRYLAELGRPVLAVDADINQHLGEALGWEGEPVPPLAGQLPWIKEYLRGSNPRITSADTMIKTTPPGRGSRMLRLDPAEDLHQRFARPIGGAQLMVTGEFEPEDVGVSCYHSKTGALELYLNHLVDEPNEYVVVDMTAGADVLSSGLFTRFDLVILVSEPTRRGIRVYRQFQQHAEEHGVRFTVVGNKVATADDTAWLHAELGTALLATIGQSPWVRAAEQGRTPAFDALEPEVRHALAAILAELDGIQRDWTAYHRDTVHFHLRNARAWANQSVGRDLADQVDPEFQPAVSG